MVLYVLVAKTAGEAQEHFLHGVATLHSFGWKQAIRAELNAVYQALGDHFFDDGIATATRNLQGIESRDQDTFMSGTAAWLRWTNWWNANVPSVGEAIRERYDAEVR